MQNIIVAISLNPVLCLVQRDGKITYLTALTGFYSLVLELFEGMASCRIYWSLCFTEKQKLPEPLAVAGATAHNTLPAKLSTCWKCESRYLHGQSLPSVCCHHIRPWFIESRLICLYFTHPAEALVQVPMAFPFPINTAEQNLFVL